MYKQLHNEHNGTMPQTLRDTGRTQLTRGRETGKTTVKWKVPWRTLHVLISLATIVSGFATFLPLGYVSKFFSQHCLLYSDIRFNYYTHNTTAVIIFSQSTWGTQSTCDVTTFTPVLASVHAFIWGWFFLLMRVAFHRRNHEFSLLIPSLLFHIGIFVGVFVSSCYINEGIDVWCKNFYREINLSQTHEKMFCKDAQTIHWDIFTQKNPFYTYLNTARAAAWFQTLCVFLQCTLCVYQMYTGLKEENKETYKRTTRDDFQASGQLSNLQASGQVSDDQTRHHRKSNGKSVIKRSVAFSPENL